MTKKFDPAPTDKHADDPKAAVKADKATMTSSKRVSKERSRRPIP